MNRKDNNTASLAILVFVMTGLTLPSMVQSKIVAPAGASDPRPEKAGAKPVVLINVDGEMVEYVARAEAQAAEKDYTDAIDILQMLLDRSEQCFVPTDDPRRFVSLAFKVREVIGRLGPEAERLYRGLYDARARRLFRAAAERFDESALRDLLCRYFYTSYGEKSLDLLGGILFDRGEFSQAARCWSRIASSGGKGQSAVRPGSRQAILLAKIAVAHHFAGEPVRAAEAMKLLTGKYPQARATIGGREQNVTTFARRVLAGPVPFADSIRAEGWPSLAGSPDSTAVMGPCKPVMDRRWTVPGGGLRTNPDIKAALGLTSMTFNLIPKSERVSLQNGQVKFTRWTGSGTRRLTIPPLVHPIIVGKTVLYRSAEAVIAHDLITGKKLWESKDFPLFRRLPKASSYLPTPVEERGLWTLTAGGGRVFAVGKFYPARGLRVLGWNIQSKDTKDTSVLAAFILADQGRLSWQVGMGDGGSDVVRGGKFLTAPTFAAGRVYTLVKYKRAHYLVCLDAENGAVVWESLIGQPPFRIIRMSSDGAVAYLPDEGSAPAVAAGKVFVTTNNNVIVAFEAGTGRPVWAYQYKSTNSLILDRKRTIGSFALISSPYQPNPVVVMGGRAIFLPADSERVLALRADTGKLEWSADRQGLQDLTAMGNSRLLLSGEGLRIIDAATGKEVWTGGKITGVQGRPAVTTDAILASGKGEIIRVSLKDFSVTRLPVKQPDAILGNLICADGKLIAANAAGVSAYFPAASTRSNQE